MLEEINRRDALKIIFYSLGAVSLFPGTVLSASPKEEKTRELRCPIYYFHEVKNRDSFEAFVSNLLVNDFFPVAMSDVADYFYDDIRVWPEDKKPVVITFDDARLSQFENAYPVLDQYRLRATYFVLQNYADGSNKYMNDEKIRELSAGGWELGVHGYTHMRLPFLRTQNPQAWENDIIGAKKRLEDITGRAVSSFAYPYGSSKGVDEETKRLVASAYRVAVTTGGSAPFLRSSELFELPRLWKS